MGIEVVNDVAPCQQEMLEIIWVCNLSENKNFPIYKCISMDMNIHEHNLKFHG